MDLLNFITPGTTVLTPNSRLSAAILKQFQQLQLTLQKNGWPSPDVLPISSWLERTFKEIFAREFAPTPRLLKAQHETLLWEEIIRSTSRYDYLLQKTATADLAKSAWETLAAWRVDINNSALNLTDDSIAFQQWGNQFAERCKKNNWLTKSHLSDIIHDAVLTGKITAPKKIILTGFTEISPQYQNLFSALKQMGCEIIHYQPQRTAQSTQKIALPDEEQEIRTMARWAKAIYDQKPENRPYYIGCVILNLEKLRSKVLQIFCEIFSEPGTFTFDNRTLPFNITAGQYLLDFPVIRTAFDLLELQQEEISLDKFSNILRSPFVGDAEQEQIKRAHYEIRLRKANASTIHINDLLEKNPCPKLAKRLQQFYQAVTTTQKSQPISAWVKHFLALLSLLGWPGERSINSFEFQVIDSWLALLNEASTLDDILEAQTFSQALYYLNQLTAKKVFQPKTPEVPIQIMGVLEAVELPFEHLWVMGLDDTRWPSAPKPNPLIPQRLQKKLHMPHATAERELIYCRELMQQLQCSARHIIFSHATKNDAADLQPSALLADIQPIEIDQLNLSEHVTPALAIYAKKELETLLDTRAPALQDEEVHGGTSIFKLQATCPFKAFAELRLHARSLESPALGLRAIDRGNIVHKALELLWQKIKSSEHLLRLSNEELKSIIEHCAQQAIEDNVEQIKNQRYIALEQLRLEKIIFQWLQIEKDRPAFTVIKREHERTVTIGKIVLTVCIDRIDELSDGTKIIIDYKTGKNNHTRNWFGERPLEPQLPLYCITDNEEIIAIAFAQLHPANLEFSGVSQNDLGIPKIKLLADTNSADSHLWSSQIEKWRSTLEKLANDFYQGIATVDPKEQQETCKLCNLQPFCRIHEKA